jgi:prepilin-type N-terminal cleavage/methylation domain-containing protein
MNKKKIIKNLHPNSYTLFPNQGFTLMETLVAVALFSVLSVAAVGVFIYTMRGAARAKTIRQLKQNGNLILERVERSVRDAQVIRKEPNQECDTTSHSQLYYADQNGNYHLLRCGVDEEETGYGQLEKDGIILNDKEIDVTSCEFVCTASQPQTVDFSMTMSLNGIEQEFSLFVSQRDY